MITVFTVCKPFEGHIGTIQANAIESWARLAPDVSVVLIGMDEGVAECARDLNVAHVPQVGTNEHGTPLMSEVFAIARRHSREPLLCYVNADIILMADFVRSARRIPFRRFLCCGKRWNTDIEERLDFGAKEWEGALRERVTRTGVLYDPAAIDYFLFPRSEFQDIPPFALGRCAFDNWMIYAARSRRLPVVDATSQIMAVHQNHHYGHFPGGATAIWNSEEAQINRRLAGMDTWGDAFLFTLNDCTHQLTKSGIRWDLRRERLRRHRVTAPILYPGLRPAYRVAKSLNGVRSSIARRMGLGAASKGEAGA